MVASRLSVRSIPYSSQLRALATALSAHRTEDTPCLGHGTCGSPMGSPVEIWRRDRERDTSGVVTEVVTRLCPGSRGENHPPGVTPGSLLNVGDARLARSPSCTPSGRLLKRFLQVDARPRVEVCRGGRDRRSHHRIGRMLHQAHLQYGERAQREGSQPRRLSWLPLRPT